MSRIVDSAEFEQQLYVFEECVGGGVVSYGPPPVAGPYVPVLTTRFGDDCYDVITHDRKLVASYYFRDDYDGMLEQVEANFRLLAAAPELMAALNALLAAVAGLPLTLFSGGLRTAIRNARAAITVAMGRD